MGESAPFCTRQYVSPRLRNGALFLPRAGQAVAQKGLRRAVCDYIAGMTDRYAQEEYLNLFSPYERV